LKGGGDSSPCSSYGQCATRLRSGNSGNADSPEFTSSWQQHNPVMASTFIHSVFCLTTGPKPPPKRFLHIVRSRASSFKLEYPLLSLRLSSSFLRLLPHLLTTSISSFIFPFITCFRRQFPRKM